VAAAGALDPEAVAGVQADGRMVGGPGGEADLVGLLAPGPVDRRFEHGGADTGAPVAAGDEHAEVDDTAGQGAVHAADDGAVGGLGQELHRSVAGDRPVEDGPASVAVERRFGAEPAAFGGHGLEGIHVGVEVAGPGEAQRERGSGGRNGGHVPW
jgi:hypothetical protein